MRKWLFSIGWVLLGLMGVAALLISSGGHEFRVNPTVSSYGVSGTSALADLLRLRGYEVVVDGHAKPKLQKNDVVVAFQLSDVTDLQYPQQVLDTESSIKHQVEQLGGLVFWLPLDTDYETASGAVKTPTVYDRPDDKTRSLTGNQESNPSSDSAMSLLDSSTGNFVSADRIGKGSQVSYGDGIGLTNRFLDRANNAQTFVEILKAFAPQAKRVVFTEATFGKVEAVGFLETLGPWAEGAWYQFVFVFLVIVFTLNQRFGLPLRLRKTQVGGRELVDALTDTMIRAKATDMGLESAYHRADDRIRRLVKLPRDASEGERDRVLPPEILTRLAEVRSASVMTEVRPADALDLVVKLEKSIQTYEAGHGGVMTRPRRRKP